MLIRKNRAVIKVEGKKAVRAELATGQVGVGLAPAVEMQAGLARDSKEAQVLEQAHRVMETVSYVSKNQTDLFLKQ